MKPSTMNVIVLGVGTNGRFLAEEFSAQGNNVCLIESSHGIAEEAKEHLDARVVEGDGASVLVLEEAGIADCDFFVSLTSNDSTNILSASLAKALGAKKTAAKVHASLQQEQWLFDYRGKFEIDYLFSSERLAAAELAKFIRSPDAILVEEFAGGRIELQQILVETGSRADGVLIRDLGLPPRVRLGSLRRGTKHFLPAAGDTLHSGDIVTIFGMPRLLRDVLPVFQKQRKGSSPEENVVIFGGGEYGLALAQLLENGPFRIRILEKDARRCQELSRVLKKTVLIHADATSSQNLREEQIGNAGFFVAATPDDEDNVMACLQAHDLGVARCITLIHRSDYADTLSRLGERFGIFGAVSPRLATRKELLRFVSAERFHQLSRLDGDIEVVEFFVPQDSSITGKKISEVPWPQGCGLIACTRGSSTNVPAADDELLGGDMIIALLPASTRHAFGKLLK